MTNTGGPAFPSKKWDGVDSYKHQEGMTLRDYFAAKALSLLRGTDVWVTANDANIAELAYRLADAMLAERDK